MKTQIHVRKESIKFASAHMTVFPDGTKESLHGHNYQVELTVELKDISFKKMVPFSDYKEKLKKLVEAWDEKVLIATENPFYEELRRDKKEVEFTLCKRRYVLPSPEVELLPLDNISSETLSAHLLSLFISSFGSKELKKAASFLKIRVEESPGQGASSEESL